MKTKRLLLGVFLLAGLLAIVVASVFGIHALISVSGISLAIAGAVGTPVQDTVTHQNVKEANEHIFKEDVVQKITKVRPSATPLDTILRTLSGKRPIKSFTTRFFSNGVRESVTTLKTAVTATSGSAVNKTHKISLSNESFADTNDLLMFQGVKGSDNDNLVGHVIEKNLQGEYTIMLLNGNGDQQRDIPAITEGTLVTRLTTAMNERDARSDEFSLVPSDDYNYCQIIMSTLSQGLYERMLEKEVDFNLTDLKDSTVYDFRRKCEGALLYGVRSLITHPTTGKEFYHMGGIVRTIGQNHIDFSTSAKASDAIVDWTKRIFVGNNGADTRYAFAGNDVLAWLSKKLAEESTKNIDAKKTEVVSGIRFNRIETEFGTLMLRHHPDFSTYGMENKILVFDPDFIEIRNLKPMGIRKIDNAANGTELSESFVMEEAFTNIVTNPAAHALIEMTK